jgi:hypothetical protein
MNRYILSMIASLKAYTTLMIYFIGPVDTVVVRKTNVLSVCQYIHLCTNNVIHLLFEVEKFAHFLYY